VARNRQRAKQRQAERRARRLAEERHTDGAQSAGPADGSRAQARREQPLLDDPSVVEPSPAVPPELAVSAPPRDEGRSDSVIEDEPDLDDRAPAIEDEALEDEALEETEDWDLDEPEPDVGAGEAGYEVRGRRGRALPEAHRERSRVVQFLIAVWAELQRVQWPNRQALTTLTGVVLGFVLIAGGYLGLLDAIFSELIQAIL
jgi:preprotein translocase subunit SecE